MVRLRVRAIVIGIASSAFISIAWMLPAYSQGDVQEAKTEAPAAKTSQTEKPVDAKAATTTRDIKIPVDELKVLVKPLTLSELEVEVAGWQAALQSKAKEISAAEVTIKRQNTAISKQQEGTDQLEKAKKALEEAEKAQRSAAPGSSQYQDATKKLEEAKENLRKAQEAVEKAKKSKAEIEQSDASRKALEKARKTGILDTAKQALDKLKADREKIDASSPAYTDATTKVDRLTDGIAVLEKAQEAQKKAKPDSPEAVKANQVVDKASADLNQILKDIGATTPPAPGQQSSSQNLNNATATLNNTNITSNPQEKVATTTGAPETANTQDLQQKQQQLQKTTEKLQKSTEAETETKNTLISTVTELQSQLTAIGDRLTVVLDELDRKGGDSNPYRQYLKAVSSIEVDAKDTQGISVRLLTWFGSEEGGLRWATNLGKFLGIVLASIVVSQILGFIIDKILRLFDRQTSNVLRQFIVITIKRGGVVVGILLALTALEVSLGPVLALLGGVSFVLAFALQSNLGNFASGLMIMVNKPFDVGDEVKIGSLWGWIQDITLANTKIRGFGGQMYTMPNNKVWGETIENLTHAPIRKIGFILRVGFKEDLNRVQQIVVETFKSHPKIEKEPEPGTLIWQIEDYYMTVRCGGWTKTEGFWTVYPEIMSAIKERFNNEGIPLAPIPTTDINLHQQSESEKGDSQFLNQQKYLGLAENVSLTTGSEASTYPVSAEQSAIIG